MPIRPENLERYPADWPEISLRIRVVRALGHCECEGECGRHKARCPARHNSLHPRTGSRVVLTVAHLDHTPENCDEANLKAMCQRCHLAYDADEHAATRIRTQAAETGRWNTPLPGLEAAPAAEALPAPAPAEPEPETEQDDVDELEYGDDGEDEETATLARISVYHRSGLHQADWELRALCREHDPEIFFPTKGGNGYAEGKRVCRMCPVRDACLAAALDVEWLHGVWGATTASERKKLREDRARLRSAA